MTTRGALTGLFLLGLLVGLTALAASDPTKGTEKPKPTAIGAAVPKGQLLRDLRGNRRPLHDFKGHKAVVVVFLGAECPVSNLYLPELVALEKKLRGKSVQFLAVYPNEAEDLDQVAAHA